MGIQTKQIYMVPLAGEHIVWLIDYLSIKTSGSGPYVDGKVNDRMGTDICDSLNKVFKKNSVCRR